MKPTNIIDYDEFAHQHPYSADVLPAVAQDLCVPRTLLLSDVIDTYHYAHGSSKKDIVRISEARELAMVYLADLYRDSHAKAKRCKPGFLEQDRPTEYADLLSAQAYARFEGCAQGLVVTGILLFGQPPHDALREWLIAKGEMTGAQTLADWANVKGGSQ